MVINEILKEIVESNEIGITFHVSPDGDSLGSSMALALALRKLGKEAYIICIDEVPENYKFLPLSSEIPNIHSVKESTDILISLDNGDVKRLNGNFELNNRKYKLINIDHHISNTLFGDLNYVNSNASSMGEIVYQLINLLDVKIDSEMATCLYTSIISDTNTFTNGNTTSITHNISGDLINTGINFSKIQENVFSNYNLSRLKLLGLVLEKTSLELDGRVCVMELTNNMLTSCNEVQGDTSDIISMGTKLKDIKVCLLIKELNNGVKVSIRSKCNFDVRKFSEYFGGGGHIKASGFSLNNNIEEAKAIIIEKLKGDLK